jgi:hypothetical protein
LGETPKKDPKAIWTTFNFGNTSTWQTSLSNTTYRKEKKRKKSKQNVQIMTSYNRQQKLIRRKKDEAN